MTFDMAYYFLEMSKETAISNAIRFMVGWDRMWDDSKLQDTNLSWVASSSLEHALISVLRLFGAEYTVDACRACARDLATIDSTCGSVLAWVCIPMQHGDLLLERLVTIILNFMDASNARTIMDMAQRCLKAPSFHHFYSPYKYRAFADEPVLKGDLSCGKLTGAAIFRMLQEDMMWEIGDECKTICDAVLACFRSQASAGRQWGTRIGRSVFRAIFEGVGNHRWGAGVCTLPIVQKAFALAEDIEAFKTLFAHGIGCLKPLTPQDVLAVRSVMCGLVAVRWLKFLTRYYQGCWFLNCDQAFSDKCAKDDVVSLAAAVFILGCLKSKVINVCNCLARHAVCKCHARFLTGELIAKCVSIAAWASVCVTAACEFSSHHGGTSAAAWARRKLFLILMNSVKVMRARNYFSVVFWRDRQLPEDRELLDRDPVVMDRAHYMDGDGLLAWLLAGFSMGYMCTDHMCVILSALKCETVQHPGVGLNVLDAFHERLATLERRLSFAGFDSFDALETSFEEAAAVHAARWSLNRAAWIVGVSRGYRFRTTTANAATKTVRNCASKRKKV